MHSQLEIEGNLVGGVSNGGSNWIEARLESTLSLPDWKHPWKSPDRKIVLQTNNLRVAGYVFWIFGGVLFWFWNFNDTVDKEL